MTAAEDKVNFDYEHSAERLQEIKTDINIIKTHAKWVLSLLAAVALALGSFVFTDLGELRIIYKSLDNADLFIKLLAGFLFILYSWFVVLSVPRLLWDAKVLGNNEDKNFIVLSKSQEAEILKARVKEYAKKLVVINKRFKRLIALSVGSPFFATASAAYFTYLA